MGSLADRMYGPASASTAWSPSPDSPGGSTFGVDFGANVGSEVFRVQLATTGLLISAFVVLLWLHRRGHRFSVQV